MLACLLPPRASQPQIEHLDGHKVQIGTQGVTRPGEVRWYQGEGMPQFEKVGRWLAGWPRMLRTLE